MANYTVQQGDHLSGIAEQFGFQSIDLIWNHPNNADLKAQRSDPHILFPGDRVFVPDKTSKSEAAPTTKVSTFQLDKTKLKLNMRMVNLAGDPLSAQTVAINVEGQNVAPFVTDGNGKTSSEIPKAAHDGLLLVNNVQLALKIGHLDPVDKQSGQIGRLNNLGYEAGDTITVDKDAFESAVEEFQCDNGLPVTGQCDGGTQAKLKAVHGC